MNTETRGLVFHLDEFREYLQFERGVSPRTLEAYGRDLHRLVQFCERLGLTDVNKLTPSLLRDFTYDLKDHGLQATSIRRTLSAIRTYFSFLLAEGYVTSDPTEQVELPKTWRRLPGVLSREDVEKILEAPDIADRLYWRDKALLEFAYASGVRVSELAGLKVRDVDLQEGIAMVFGKGSKERLVPIGRSAQRALDIYLRETRPALARQEGGGVVFLNAQGRPLSRMGIWKILRKHVRRAGVNFGDHADQRLVAKRHEHAAARANRAVERRRNRVGERLPQRHSQRDFTQWGTHSCLPAFTRVTSHRRISVQH